MFVGTAVASAAPRFTSLSHAAPLPVPTPQQLAYQGSISALIHFGMATFFHDGDPGFGMDWLATTGEHISATERMICELKNSESCCCSVSGRIAVMLGSSSPCE